MSDEKSEIGGERTWSNACQTPSVADPELAAFLDLAAQLGPGDAAALAAVVRRAADVCQDDGEAVALAMLEQIEAILKGRRPNA